MQGGCPLLADWGVGCSAPPFPLSTPKTMPIPQTPDTVDQQLAQEYGKVSHLHRRATPPALPRKSRPNPTKGFQTQPLPNHPQPPRPDRDRRPAAPHPPTCCRRLPASIRPLTHPAKSCQDVPNPTTSQPPRPDRERHQTASHPPAGSHRRPAVNPTVDTPCRKLPKPSEPNHPNHPDQIGTAPKPPQHAPTRHAHPSHRSAARRSSSPRPFDIPHAQAIPCLPNPAAGHDRRTLTLSGGLP